LACGLRLLELELMLAAWTGLGVVCCCFHFGL